MLTTANEDIERRLWAARQELSHCVQNLVIHSQDSLIWRNQWPVYVAAVDTEDTVYANNLLQILDNRYATLAKSKFTSREENRVVAQLTQGLSQTDINHNSIARHHIP